jgi:hypothetical protein
MTKRMIVTNDKILKNSLLNTLLSWFNHIALQDIISYNEANDTEKLIMDIEKFYSKNKPIQVNSFVAEKLTEKLKATQKLFEDAITIFDEKGNMKVDEKGNIETIPYSPQLLSISVLDYMLNVERDISLRLKFGHINTTEALFDIESRDKQLYYSTLKILNKIYNFLGA